MPAKNTPTFSDRQQLMYQFTRYRDSSLTVNGDSHLSLASTWRPDHPGPTKAAQAYRNQCWGNDDQNGIETMLSTGERN
jgi:hypothetical protein